MVLFFLEKEKRERSGLRGGEKFSPLLTKSFLGGQGGRFFKKAPLAAGGKIICYCQIGIKMV
jgi:hypothetical protein